MVNPFPVPLNALQAITIVARTGALAPAAEELGVTPGAVSQHIRRAEERLGKILFERTASGMVPTEVLREALPGLQAGFQELMNAGRALQNVRDCVLTVTMGNVFASRLLVWRLAKFTALHPEIEVRLAVTGQMLDFVHDGIDCGIRFGHGDWPGMQAEPIGGETYQPVCAPSLAGKIRSPRDLVDVPVIRDESTMLSWDTWWQTAGIDDPPKPSGPVYSDPALAFDAAISAQGVLLAVDLMSADAVSDGRLVRPFNLPAQSGVGYWLTTPPGRLTPKVRAFRDWLASEVADSAGGYVRQLRGSEKRLLPIDASAVPDGA